MGHWKLRLGVVVVALWMAGGVAQAAPPIGEPAPEDLLGVTPDGEEVRISEHRGKAMVVSFWASWCGYCRKQFPALDYLQTAAGRDNLRVVVVNFKEAPREYRDVRRALRKSSVTWTHDRDGALSEAFGVSSVPHMFIFDKAGKLHAIRRGYSEESLARTIDLINEVLRQPAPDEAAPEVPSGDGGEVAVVVES
ncbi:MAG TPA: TlpA disulfide reductase family protein [Luteimonas sp.]|nr:TlpA disulfide reductase family protein [Luteimonas sp.]HRO27318.1 TlpA disulfide reductase family protein [Luteimonas sp.]HRP73563.1 TlpA disulfide reductase family protein [Luteimonas sp.]